MGKDFDVIIVGAGLAGLTCGLTLNHQGLRCRILEAWDDIGGCLRTDKVDGFLLDRGFQVLSTAYPVTRRLLDFTKLDLHTFYPGALVWYAGRFRLIADPFRHPLASLFSLFGPIGTLHDKLLVGRLRQALVAQDERSPISKSDRTALESLRDFGFSDNMIDRFFRPFLSGVFQDRELETSEQKFLFVMKMFALGDTALPKLGMGAIPAQLAAKIPEETIQLGARVVSIQGDSILLSNGERMSGKAVVVATDLPGAKILLPQFQIPTDSWRSVTCLYYSAPHPPVSGPFLILNGEQEGPVNHLSVLSQVAPSYAPPGHSLISVSIIGSTYSEGLLDSKVRYQLGTWFGKQVQVWKLIRSYSIPHAQPLQKPGFQTAQSVGPRIAPGLYFCGIHKEFATIEGAINSGRKTAQAILEEVFPSKEKRVGDNESLDVHERDVGMR